ncbi:3-methyladenine DNA glycosylase [Amycolatopsis sp. FDAARGOS 1241]|uniref:3-methyladenine DNA glycosylase n=1 Tax=Amycolatopsis sp. FDAARGOS 1241 TaxID=2778070 RepID=UPI00194DEEA6|nr:3-methyladenine DNA glycosylase [Amycolatopsis sp. FDAARGOS 1241]QRP49638.1 3-methyladenine DNA glycosylase [Amycolatopsis sp. FDAARGOS 1241]
MTGPVVLAEPQWRARERAHVQRMRAWIAPHQERRARGEKHPVLDFLFTYYSYRPGHLERWQPGPGVVLAGPGARRFLDRPAYVETDDGVTLDPAAFTGRRVSTAEFVLRLLDATASRSPRLSCFGLHEWAMVYGEPAAEVRHSQVPLRLGSAGTDRVVEALEIRCGHFDAFRFFTPPARQRNTLEPARENQVEFEQPGCLHANMDLFKWAYKLDPFVPAELVADCFELAADIRELDMRASPYDLAGYGYSAVRIETPEGRAEYARAQGAFARRAAPLRARLIEHCRHLLGGNR